jgi:DNA-binding Lrp family transcriptional regulator
MALLAEDPRMPVSDLAERLGVSRPTARRRLGAALATRQLVLRCDVSQVVAGWPVSAILWAAVPPGEHASAAAALARLPESRLVSGITGGPSNLMVGLWLSSLDDLHRLEIQLAEHLPRLQIVDRAIAVRHIKRIGRHLDRDGFGTPRVDLDPWASGAPTPA